MNDQQIRRAFHAIFLPKVYDVPTALVLDELGLQHGRCRADIAVIDGRFDGFEIKSDADTLNRLDRQVLSYNAVFDHATLIVSAKHLRNARNVLPDWWGIIMVVGEDPDQLQFEVIRESGQNELFDDYALAQLLWRDEAQEILLEHAFPKKDLRKPRSILYRYLAECMPSVELRHTVSYCLKKRQSWRRL